MKTILKNIANSLMLKAVHQRLDELNSEREALLEIVRTYTPNDGVIKFSDHAKIRNTPKRKRDKSKKRHWTQTPEGKEFMRQRMKKYWTDRKKAKNG